jgi:hypothetical protein
MNLLLLFVVLLLGAVFYLPVYLPFLISFAVKSKDWREVRWMLRIAVILNLFFVLTTAPGVRHDFGNDVGGNIAGAAHNFPIAFMWVWGGSLICTIIALVIGQMLRLKRRQNTGPLSTTETK